ncbi:hypothetical protein NADFUDRAFT_72594 [Nadsonia fulvescens var. elongata DSM 6958]|uniref:Cation-transporting ATPase n=1 Tax=Nadsonia fulvescens var. elongata DSM 6958 TaxID=857566 RepID=A0A1E3PRX7_9ASCO|nr:hypothetical protein NADFUDRAFT_72594 [Nadsonia fulvescens var. elongata DSM 6958]
MAKTKKRNSAKAKAKNKPTLNQAIDQENSQLENSHLEENNQDESSKPIPDSTLVDVVHESKLDVDNIYSVLPTGNSLDDMNVTDKPSKDEILPETFIGKTSGEDRYKSDIVGISDSIGPRVNRRLSNASIASTMSNSYSYYAEEASEEIFSGPVSDSIPTSYSAFHHYRGRSSRRESVNESVKSRSASRPLFLGPGNSAIELVAPGTNEPEHSPVRGRRPRNESISSNFHFFTQDEVEQAEGASTSRNETDPIEYEVQLREGLIHEANDNESFIETEFGTQYLPHYHPQLSAHSSSFSRQQKPGFHGRERSYTSNATESLLSDRSSAESYYYTLPNESSPDEPLLDGNNEIMTEQEQRKRIETDARFSIFTKSKRKMRDHLYDESSRIVQRFYISEEDLVLVIKGYKTTGWKLSLTTAACFATLGVFYLLLRWFPKWRIACTGTPCPLGHCDWVIIETEWGDINFIDVHYQKYNRYLSTIFQLNNDNNPLGDGNIQVTTDTESEANSFSSRNMNYEDSNGGNRDPLIHTLRFLNYRCMKFIYNPMDDMFITNYDWIDKNWIDYDYVKKGLDSDTHDDREIVFGLNQINIPEKTTMELLVDEVLHPFYIFQVFSIVLWSLDEYFYYASCIFLVSLISVGNTLAETKRNMSRLSEISKFECDVRVLRNDFWTTIKASALVPGDIYEVSDPSVQQFPCDSILLSGDCIVNESMLTGESVPVSKFPASSETLYRFTESSLGGSNISPEIAKHFVFSGTRIIRVRKPYQQNEGAEGPALAMVVRTGFSTTKGALIRSMLFPKPGGFKFYRDSFKFIGVMGCISIVGFIICTINFIKMRLPTHLIVFRALDIITIVVPPALPATLTIGTNIALSRLRKKSIFCISPNRVNIGGKLDVVCFDKTGTLTEDGLDVLGVHTVNDNHQLSELYENIDKLTPNSMMYNNDFGHSRQKLRNLKMMSTMNTCHSLHSIDGELMGDPLDIKMFEFTDCDLNEDGKLDPKYAKECEEIYGHKISTTIISLSKNKYTSPSISNLIILRSFEFVPQLRRMAVINSELDEEDFQVFVKGAPEIMPEICRAESFPDDYNEILHHYTHKGYRVIACAAKTLYNHSFRQVQTISREDVEKNLEFLGFIVFENKLKPTTTNVIDQLNEAKIRTIMCTGDNILTAISVGRECNIVEAGQTVFVPHFVEDKSDYVLRWESVDNSDIILNPATLTPVSSDIYNYTLAVSGEVFRYVINQSVTTDEVEDAFILNKMLMKSSIYARMSPDEKHELVEKLQKINYTTCFCGDGANDCGALKAADVGISLSEAEASVAAPFTSRHFEISCVLDVIREGRAALVTSFSCFKFMSLYSAIQFVSVSVLYSRGSNLGDFQFLFIDLFLILPIAIFMAWSKPLEKICIKRPNSNLISRKVLVPLVFEILIMLGFQMLVWYFVKQQDWYIAPVPGVEDSEVDSSDNTILFFYSCFQYILIALALSVGPPYREDISKNIPFVSCITLTIVVTLSIVFFVDSDSFIGRLLNLTPTSVTFKLFLVSIALVNLAISWFSEKQFFRWICDLIVYMKRVTGIGHKKHKKKFYKALAKSLEV